SAYIRVQPLRGIVAMYTIELTRGAAWDAPVLEVHPVRRAVHILDIERMAQALLTGARQTSKQLRPTDYRILDPLGKCVRSSAAAVSRKTSMWRAGRSWLRDWQRRTGGAPRQRSNAY